MMKSKAFWLKSTQKNSNRGFKIMAILIASLFIFSVFTGIGSQSNISTNISNNIPILPANNNGPLTNTPVSGNSSLPTTADLLWEKNDGYVAYSSGLAVHGNHIYVSPQGEHLMVYNLNGTNTYNITTTETLYPTFGNGNVYFATSGNDMEAATLLTGEKVYTESIPSASSENSFTGYQFFNYSNYCVYEASNGNHYLTAFNSSLGTLEWKYDSYFSISTAPTVGDYEVVIGSSNSHIISAINSTDGILNWNATISSYPSADISFYNNTFFCSNI